MTDSPTNASSIEAEASRQDWEEQNREHLAAIAARPPTPEQANLLAKLVAAKQRFVLMPEPQPVSPLDVPGVTPAAPSTREDILASIAAGRRRDA